MSRIESLSWRITKKVYDGLSNRLSGNTAQDEKMVFDAAKTFGCSDMEAAEVVENFYKRLRRWGPAIIAKQQVGENKMKKFSEFLSESVRDYKYIVKLAFKPDNETMSAIENALQKYSISSITQPRSLPIKRRDADFPGLVNPETYQFEVSVKYPAPQEHIRHTLAIIGLALENVYVATGEPDSIYFPAGQPSFTASLDKQDDAVSANTSDKALLNKGYDPQDNREISGEHFGDAFNEKLVKNSIGSTDQMIPREFKKTKGATTNDPEFKIGEKSAVGSTDVKKPTVRSFAR